MMDLILSNMSQWHWIVAIGVGCCAGFIKGVVGFAMPMVFIAGLSLIVPPELALAGLILPTVITNIWQAFAQGRAAAWQSVKRFRLFLITGLVCVLISAQLASVLPDILFLGSLGGLIVCFSLFNVHRAVSTMAMVCSGPIQMNAIHHPDRRVLPVPSVKMDDAT